MSRILVTGGAGGLGREVVSRLRARGETVRVMSRSPRPPGLDPGIEWATAEVISGEGLADAVSGVDVIVNSMTGGAGTQSVDVEGTRNLLMAARAASASHVVHVSIVGIELMPNPYYDAKVAAEHVVIESGVPYSIWRATQFHTLLDRFLAPLRDGGTAPILSAPANRLYQLIDTGEAAEALIPHVLAAPAGRVTDTGGPEVLSLESIARQWQDAQGLAFPLHFADAVEPPPAAATTPENRFGSITWADYLERVYGRRPARG